MWIKKASNNESRFVHYSEILDYNIISRKVHSATSTLELITENNEVIICKPHKTDYNEWLNMLHLSRIVSLINH